MKTKILTITIIIILLATAVLYGVRLSITPSTQPNIEDIKPQEITSTQAQYVSETGDEAHVNYYSNNTASLTLIGSEYKDIQFTHATSASGARYENTDLGLILWEKAPDLTIYKDEEPIFSGRKWEVLAKDKIEKLLPSKKWFWAKTVEGEITSSNPVTITPKKTDVFSLAFSSDGNVTGTTDCNTFSGSYSIEGNQIKFGNFMSTLMYCEDSQEQEFVQMIKNSLVSVSEDELMLQTEKETIFFEGK